MFITKYRNTLRNRNRTFILFLARFEGKSLLLNCTQVIGLDLHEIKDLSRKIISCPFTFHLNKEVLAKLIEMRS
jgi:hypothetical protein